MIFKFVYPILVLLLVAGCNTGPEFERTNENDPGSDTYKPDAPSFQDREITEEKHVILRWNDRTDFEDGYLIEKKLAETDTFSVVDVVSSDIITYTDSSLSLTATTSYRISPFVYDENGEIDEISKNYANSISLNLNEMGELKLRDLGEEIRIEWEKNLEYFDAITFGYIEVGNSSGETIWADTISVHDSPVAELNDTKTNHIDIPTTAFQYDIIVQAHLLDPGNSYSTFSTSEERIKVNSPIYENKTFEDEETLLIEWSSAVPDVESYEIYKGSFANPYRQGELVATLPGDVLQYRFEQTFEDGNQLNFGIRGIKYGVKSYLKVGYAPFRMKRLENFRLTPQENSVQLNWDIPENPEQPYTRFILERSVGGKDNFEVYAELPTDAIEFTDNNITKSNIYYYRIRSASSDYTDIIGVGYITGLSLQKQIQRAEDVVFLNISRDEQEVGAIERLDRNRVYVTDLIGNERVIHEPDFELFWVGFSRDNRHILVTGDSVGVAYTNIYDRQTLERKFQIKRENLAEPILLIPGTDYILQPNFKWNSTNGETRETYDISIFDMNTGEVQVTKTGIAGSYPLRFFYDIQKEQLITIHANGQIKFWDAGDLSEIKSSTLYPYNRYSGIVIDEVEGILYISEGESIYKLNLDTEETTEILSTGRYGPDISRFQYLKGPDLFAYSNDSSKNVYLYNSATGLISLAVEGEGDNLIRIRYDSESSQLILQNFISGTLFYDLVSKWTVIY